MIALQRYGFVKQNRAGDQWSPLHTKTKRFDKSEFVLVLSGLYFPGRFAIL